MEMTPWHVERALAHAIGEELGATVGMNDQERWYVRYRLRGHLVQYFVAVDGDEFLVSVRVPNTGRRESMDFALGDPGSIPGAAGAIRDWDI
jgi:hypothetical protein